MHVLLLLLFPSLALINQGQDYSLDIHNVMKLKDKLKRKY